MLSLATASPVVSMYRPLYSFLISNPPLKSSLFAFFGKSVALLDDTLISGASGHSNVGKAYRHERDTGGADAWGQDESLTASDASVVNASATSTIPSSRETTRARASSGMNSANSIP